MNKATEEPLVGKWRGKPSYEQQREDSVMFDPATTLGTSQNPLDPGWLQGLMQNAPGVYAAVTALDCKRQLDRQRPTQLS